ncbi:Ig-like domain-containing protein [Listeria newyorkensis]|uniref:Modifier protein of major autolysin LytC n=1 Tax=Listeria newyorkensis TaxID=1497681 RepID=A0A841Z0H5_9LIST|nr:Ig-like domain-containing protein [Listeria newyorkensis]MBC1459170.1 hypothetical protein [Listeria newyorkensis]
MNKNMKKIAIALVATNVLASTFITALPNTVAANETMSQGEKKLLTALQATSVPIIQNATFTYDSKTNTIPGWKFASVASGGTVTGDSPLLSNGNGSYNVVDGNFRVTPSGAGISVYSVYGRTNVMYQTINTIPGETYTFQYNATLTSSTAELLHAGIRVYDQATNGIIVNSPQMGASPAGQFYSKTFVATGTTTRLEITNLCLAPTHGNNQTINFYNVSATASNTTAPSKPVINPMTDKSTVISGTAKAYSTVSLYVGSNFLGDVRADASGNYSMSAGPYAAGTKIGATATSSGLVSDKSEITVSATAIAKPTINSITDKSTAASGTGEPNSTLTLTTGTGSYTTSVDSYGNWSVVIPKQVAGITVEATSVKNGIVSPKASTVVLDVTAPDAPLINAMDSKAATIQGNAEANSTVKLYANDTYIGSTKANASGNYSMAAGPYAAGTKISATATDAAGNESTKTNITVTAATIATPVINQLTDQSTIASGTGEPNSTLSLKIDNLTYSANVDGNGNWSTNISKPKAGIVAEATSVKGGITSAKATTTVIDVTAPYAPTVDEMTDKTAVVKGSAEPYSTVKVYANNTFIGDTNADRYGNYSLAVSPYAVGTKISATATDAAGNVSGKTEITVAASAIVTPKINTITDKSTTASGTAEPNSALSLKIGGITYAVPVDSNGNWSTAIPKPMAGTVVEATSMLNNITSAKATTTVIDVTAPDAPILKPVTDKDTHVKGTGEPLSIVTITLPNNLKISSTVDANGNFDVIIPAQAKDAMISATLTDAAGNISAAGTTIVTHQGPSAPTVNDVTDKSTTVTGTGEPGDTITVKITDNGTSISYTGKVDDFGEYSIPVDRPNADAKVEVIAKDSTGALSPKTSTTVKDVTAPDAPDVQAVLDSDTKVKGQGEPNCDVSVKLPSGGTVTGRTDADGHFEVTIPKQQAGKVLQVTLTDAAGNESKLTSVTVQSSTVAIPTISGVTTDDTSVKGKGIAGAVVTLTIAGNDYTGTVDKDGNYSIAILKQAVGTVISAKQTLNGKTSDSVVATVTQGSIATTTIDALTADVTMATGTAEPNAALVLKNAAGATIGSGTVGSDGKYSITIPKQVAGTVVTATATKADKTSSASTTVTASQAIAQTTINSLTTDSTSVSGTAEPNATFVVNDQNGAQLATGRTGSDGMYSVTIAKQVAGTIVTTTATLNGQISSASTTVIRDGIAATTLDTLTADSTVATGTAEPNAAIVIKSTAGATIGSGTVGSDGKYSITIPRQAEGSVVTATATKDGKSTNGSTTVTAGKGIAATTIDTVTADATVATGTAEPNATIVIKSGSTTIGSGTVGSDGKYSMTIPKQAAGTVVTATATVDGKSSSASTTVAAGQAIAKTTLGALTNESTVASGTAEPNAIITVKNAAGTTIGSGSVGSDGKYSITIPKQAAGTVVTATATKDGKTSSASTTIADESITKTTISDVTVDSTSVSGTGEPNGTIVIKNGTTTITSGKVASDGTYYFNIAKQAAGSTITATVTKASNGKTSSASTTIADDTIAQTTIGILNADSTTVSGVAEANSAIVIKNGTTTIASGTVASNGTYQLTIAKQAAGSVIIATATKTSNGKTSSASTTVAAVALDYTLTAKDYKIGDANLTGAYGKNIAKVRLFVNGTLIGQATTNNGTFTFANIASYITKPTDKVEVVGVDSAYVERARTTVKVTGTAVYDYSLTANDYTLGDTTLTGKYGKDISKVRLWVNNVVVAQATTNADGTYNFNNVSSFVKLATDKVEVVGVNTAYNEVARTTVVTKGSSILDTSLVPNAYAKGSANLTGTYGKDIAKVRLWVNGTVVAQASTSGTNFTFNNIASFITSKDDVVEVVGVDAQYKELNRKTVTLTGFDTLDNALTAPTDFTLNQDKTITGTFGTNVSKVRLSVNGVIVKQANTTGGTYTIANADSYITKTSDIVKIIAVDAQYKEVNSKTVTVKDSGTVYDYKLVPNTYTFGDETITGTYGKDVSSVRLWVNGVPIKVAVLNNGSFTIKGLSTITSPTDLVEVVAVNSGYKEVARVTVQ